MFEYEELIEKLIFIGETEGMTDAFEMLRACEPTMMDSRGNEFAIEDSDVYRRVHELNRELRRKASVLAKRGDDAALDLYRRSVLFDAPHDFDAYCIYLEWNRPYEKKFYEPRRDKLLPIVREMQRLIDDELDLLALSTPPGVGKSTLELFFMTMVGGRNPELPNLMGSHSNGFLKGMYSEVQRILDPAGEYLFADIFPNAAVCGNDSRNMRIDLGEPKRFETFEFSSIGSGNAGKVRAGGYLICDDLIDGIETAMSKDRLDKIWQQYYTDLRQRKIGRCKELIIGTRWSIYDHIGRLEEQYSGNPRAKFIRYPALDENDESLWDYPMNLGFTTKFFREQRKIMDSASFAALYQNEPIEREGQLYAPAELRRYYSLPEVPPDRVVAVCDSKAKGEDFCVMPVAFVYGKDWYIESFLCDNGKPEMLEERIVAMAADKGIAQLRIESNAGGSLFSDAIAKLMRERLVPCNVTTNYNTTNKETRILVGSSWVKEHCLFRAESEYEGYSEYGRAMGMLCGYTMSGHNKHDDVPDAMAELADFARGGGKARATLKKRIF